MKRLSKIERKTKETQIIVSLCLDGKGDGKIDSGIPFLNHMLELFSKHGLFDLEVKAKGDIEVDYHHTMEDLGIVIGTALKEAIGDKKGIRRYGFCILPMDEALALVSLDISGRPALSYELNQPVDNVSGIDVRLFREFFYAIAVNAGITLHIKLLAGQEIHHILESVFKAFAKALSQAVEIDPRVKGVPSTKGIL
jgi:imidazoleglycerol-phosphate dehydratase